MFFPLSPSSAAKFAEITEQYQLLAEKINNMHDVQGKGVLTVI